MTGWMDIGDDKGYDQYKSRIHKVFSFSILYSL